MSITVRNYLDADRRSGTAGEAMVVGDIVKATNSSGKRVLMKLANADSALVLSGNYGVVWKVAAKEYQVLSTTANTTVTGDRRVTIAANDQVVELRKGAIIEYSATDLHSSLNPGSGGTLPVPGQALQIVDSKFCLVGTPSAITTPITARVFEVNGTGATAKVSIELVY